MNASTFLKETTALLGLLATIYLWSIIGLALQN